ncbi:serine/threonine protein kinase [Corallococcus exercitus]|uniref:Serine/threonine protein kinase n=1 Tax=Corallococcus exercitus TaxID=2316736 RepID=A0A7Y4JN03_9BACT|nr:serine/threonine protein kinase [Corallococcus exercitus]
MTSHVGQYQRIRLLAEGIIEDHLAKAAGPLGIEKTLVLQCLRPDMAEQMEFPELFLDTARTAARLTHPHLVKVFDFGEADGTYFLAREHVDGISLSRLIQHLAVQRMTLPATLCARIISQACEGLAYAHDLTHPETHEPLRLIHRCLRPYNVLLSRQGTTKVVDFGIDHLRSRWTPEHPLPVMSSYVYMAPEEIRGERVDRRVDVYALGVVLYELLTTRRPFSSTSEWDLPRAVMSEPMVPAEQHRPDLPGVLRAILARALAKDRDQRYPDCHVFREDLEQFIRSEGEPVTPRQVAQLVQQITASDDPETQARPCLRRGWILAAAVGLGSLLGGGALLWKMSAAPEPEKVRATPP